MVSNVGYGDELDSLMEMSNDDLRLAVPKEISDKIIDWKIEKERRSCLDNTAGPLSKRFNSYIELARVGHKQYRPGNDVPNLTRLSEYVNRDRTSIGDLSKSIQVNRVVYETLLCLAAIYPPPAPGQSAREARKYRLKVADCYMEGEGCSGLLEFLLCVIESPEDYDF